VYYILIPILAIHLSACWVFYPLWGRSRQNPFWYGKSLYSDRGNQLWRPGEVE